MAAFEGALSHSPLTKKDWYKVAFARKTVQKITKKNPQGIFFDLAPPSRRDEWQQPAAKRVERQTAP